MLFVAGCNKGEDVAAVVNGEPITMTQFHKHLELMPTVQVVVDPARLQSSGSGPLQQQPYKGQVVGSLGLQALSDLINQTVLRQLAKSEGVYPTDKQIDDELNERKDANPGFVRDLTNRGFTLSTIRNDIALSLAQYNLTTKGITVSDAEVDNYITEHPKEFIAPATVDMTWMLVPDDKKAAADADLKAGVSFMTVAQKYTVAQNSARMGYRFPEQSVPALAKISPDLMKAVEGTEEQHQTPWMKFTDGWAKFYVNKKNAERKVPIDDKMKKRVYKAMMLQKGILAKDLDERLQKRLADAKILIKIESLKDPFERSLETLKATAGSEATTTGAGQ